MNNAQHTHLSAELMLLVEKALQQAEPCDDSLARQLTEAMTNPTPLANEEPADEVVEEVVEEHADIESDLRILALSNKIVAQLPESAGGLLKHLAHSPIQVWGVRHQLYASYENLITAKPITPRLTDSLMAFLTYEIESSQRRICNKHKELRPLLIKAHEAFRKSGMDTGHAVMQRFIELSVTSLSQVDDVAKDLTSAIYRVTKSSKYDNQMEATQTIITTVINPYLRFLTACASHVPVFGASLEDMLDSMNKLKEAHENLLKQACRPLEGDVVDPHAIAQFILRAFTLDAGKLSSEMALPQQFSTYAFGWNSTPGFKSHLVVAGLNCLMPWLNQVVADTELLSSAKMNFVGCLANWCGHPSRSNNGSINRQLFKVMLDTVFDESSLQGALERVNDEGMQVLTEYVMDNHRALARLLPRSKKGEYLSDALGL
jgi:hypothetical protein